jgi:hypothetical protein
VSAAVDQGRLAGEREARARSAADVLRAGYAELLAAARASVAAAARGDADPVAWIRGVLEDRGQLPAPGARPVQVVADARSAMELAGWLP